MINSKKCLVRCLFAAAFMSGVTGEAAAAPLLLDAHPFNWSTTSGNAVVSVPEPVPQLMAMWSCPVGVPCPTATHTSAYFKKTFDLQMGEGLRGGFNIIADDYFEVWINGDFAFAAMLDNNKDSNQNPDFETVPLKFFVEGRNIFQMSGNLLSQGDLDNVFRKGSNTIEIQAYDGHYGLQAGVSCDDTHVIPLTQNVWCETDRGDKYLALISDIEIMQGIPEPSTLALILIGAFGAYSRTRARNKSEMHTLATH